MPRYRLKNARKAKRVLRTRRPRKNLKSLRRSIKSIVKRSAETKKNQLTPEAKNITQTITNAQVFNLIPPIGQGVGHADRVGNKIMPIRLTVKLVIVAANVNLISPGSAPTFFDIYIYKFKGNNMTLPTAVDMGRFLENDNITSSYTGLPLDGLRPLNSDMFNLLYKKRIMLSNFTNSGTVTGVFQTTQPCRCLTINLSKHIKKTLLFDDSNFYVTNDNMYISIGATQANGEPLAGNMGSYQYFTDFMYKDI